MSLTATVWLKYSLYLFLLFFELHFSLLGCGDVRVTVLGPAPWRRRTHRHNLPPVQEGV